MTRLSRPDDQPIHKDLYGRVGAQAALRSGDWRVYRGLFICPHKPDAQVLKLRFFGWRLD